MVTTSSFIFKRKEAIEYLVSRDGYKCQYPECDKPFDEGNHCLTIDHIVPQKVCREQGWSFEDIWDHSNLQLMGKSCNARKGHLLYDENGNLPIVDRPPKVSKAERPAPCNLCESGRLLLEEEICGLCGSGPQPASAPKYLQVQPKDCDHSTLHCWMCFTGLVERKSAIDRIIGGP